MVITNSNGPRGKEAGYTLLMVVFLVATLMITLAMVTPNLGTEGRREKEAEMIWRGEQYERAIGLYSIKFNGKYPTKIEDLTKQTNGVRFLRQAYSDPMNKDDGSWRFIYVGPNGQLIGSLRPASMLPMMLSNQAPGASPFGGPSQGIQQMGGPGQQPGIGVPGQQAGSNATGNPLDSQPQPLTGAVLGGSIIGIGSKIKKPSLRVYMGADNYLEWEFIFNPNAQIALPGQAPTNPNGAPGATPNGITPNGGFGGPPNGGNPNSSPPSGSDPNAPVGAPPPNPQTPNGNGLAPQ